ncbi:MAG: MFS transporter [Clostridia bacterium]|nr:MFS transporter [Clostridia bacterium]MDD4679600.1 MFS transporter [Clostridia bacterium]
MAGLKGIKFAGRDKFAGFKTSILELFGKSQEFSQNRRNILISNYNSVVANNLIGGNFFTGFLLLMNINDSDIGLITVISMFGNMLQVFSPLLLERFEKRKKILIIGRIVIHFINIVLISIIPILAPNDSMKLSLILVATLLVNVLNAMTAPGYQVWHIKSVPNEMRSRYFSFIQLTNSIIVYTVILFASLMVDVFKQNGNELTGLLILRGAALVLAVFDIVYLARIREYPVSKRNMRVRDVMLSPFKEKKFLVTVAMACMWSFTANIPGSYYSVYLLRELNISYSFLNTVNMLSIPVMILVMPIWRRKVDTTSWFRTLYLCISLYIVHYLGLAFVTEKNLLLYLIFMLYAFAISPGINLVFSNLPYVNMPDENQTNLLGFYSTLNSFAGFLGASLGRQFITMTEGMRIKFGGTTMGNKQLVLILAAVFMLASALTIFRLTRKSDSEIA